MTPVDQAWKDLSAFAGSHIHRWEIDGAMSSDEARQAVALIGAVERATLRGSLGYIAGAHVEFLLSILGQEFPPDRALWVRPLEADALAGMGFVSVPIEGVRNSTRKSRRGGSERLCRITWAGSLEDISPPTFTR